MALPNNSIPPDAEIQDELNELCFEACVKATEEAYEAGDHELAASLGFEALFIRALRGDAEAERSLEKLARDLQEIQSRRTERTD